MKTLLSIRGRLIADTDIEQVRSLIDKYGNRSRAYISVKLAETWKWYQANGYFDRVLTSEDGPDGSISVPVIEDKIKNSILI